MIDIQLELKGETLDQLLKGGVWNASGFNARSDYGYFFAGRETHGYPMLRRYPRWCEPVRGLVARCLALSSVPMGAVLTCSWELMVLEIALRPGGGSADLLDTVAVERSADGNLNFVRASAIGEVVHVDGIAPRASYADPWDLAEHALRITTFDGDDLPPPKELDVPIRRDLNLSFVCTRDIPEPARSVFTKRMEHSTRPVIHGHPDAVYAWDWLDFLSDTVRKPGAPSSHSN